MDGRVRSRVLSSPRSIGVCCALMRGGGKIRLGKRSFISQCPAVIDPGAHVLRETTGTPGLEQTAWAAAATLAHFDIPHLKDKADVVELIQARRLPRDLHVAAAIHQHYLEAWDALQAER